MRSPSNEANFKDKEGEDAQEQITFESAAKECLKRRSSIVELVNSLNRLEVIEEAMFTDYEMKLIPLVLLLAKKKESEAANKKNKQKSKIIHKSLLMIYGEIRRRLGRLSPKSKSLGISLTATTRFWPNQAHLPSSTLALRTTLSRLLGIFTSPKALDRSFLTRMMLPPTILKSHQREC